MTHSESPRPPVIKKKLYKMYKLVLNLKKKKIHN